MWGGREKQTQIMGSHLEYVGSRAPMHLQVGVYVMCCPVVLEMTWPNCRWRYPRDKRSLCT